MDNPGFEVGDVVAVSQMDGSSYRGTIQTIKPLDDLYLVVREDNGATYWVKGPFVSLVESETEDLSGQNEPESDNPSDADAVKVNPDEESEVATETEEAPKPRRGRPPKSDKTSE